MVKAKNKYGKIIFAIIAAFLSFAALNNVEPESVSPADGPMAAIVFALLFCLMYRTDFMPEKSSSFGIPASLAVVFGLIRAVISSATENYKHIVQTSRLVGDFFEPYSIVLTLGTILLFYAVLYHIFRLFDNHETVGIGSARVKCKEFFIMSWLIILVCYLPYFISECPAVVTEDSANIIAQIQGKLPLSNAHPIFYTGFLFVFYKLGYLFSSSVTAAVATAAFAQMLLMSGIFAYTLTFMYKRNVKRPILVFALCFWALFPLNAYYSITLWKDVPFGGLMLLLVLSLIRLVEKFDTLRLRDLIPFTVISIFTVLCRNNALYMMPILFIAAFVIFRGKRKLIAASFAVIFASTTIITGPIFNLAGITRSSSCEYIGIPLQQVARIVCKDGDMSEEDREMINRLVPIETIKEMYKPFLVDGIKQHPTYDMEYFDTHKLEFLKLWARLVIKNPATAVDAYIAMTLGYVYPFQAQTVSKGILYSGVSDLGINDVNEHFTSLDKLESFTFNTTPFNSLWMIGAWVWATAIFAAAMAKKKGWRSLIITVPGAGVWLTLLVATPINWENRYMYFAHAALPLMLGAVGMMPNFRLKEKKKHKK